MVRRRHHAHWQVRDDRRNRQRRLGLGDLGLQSRSSAWWTTSRARRHVYASKFSTLNRIRFLFFNNNKKKPQFFSLRFVFVLFCFAGVQVQPAYPSGEDCRAYSGMCSVCNDPATFDMYYAGTKKCKFCSASSSTAFSQVRPGCYPHDPAVGPACIGQSAAAAQARQGSGLTEDPNCKSCFCFCFVFLFRAFLLTLSLAFFSHRFTNTTTNCGADTYSYTTTNTETNTTSFTSIDARKTNRCEFFSLFTLSFFE